MLPGSPFSPGNPGMPEISEKYVWLFPLLYKLGYINHKCVEMKCLRMYLFKLYQYCNVWYKNPTSTI